MKKKKIYNNAILSILGCIFCSSIYTIDVYIELGNVVFRCSHLIMIIVWLSSIEIFLNLCSNKINKSIFFISGLSISIVSCYLFNNGKLYGFSYFFTNVFMLILHIDLSLIKRCHLQTE